uniref:SWIM-type domain-containing protein n=1 Tax=Setaria italica TaxID=4555 RepID=K4ALQ4_SETIT
MRQQVARFDSPTFDDIISRVNSLFKVGNEEDDLRICGRFDAGNKRSHYVLMPLACDDDWLVYKELVKGSQVACAKLVVDVCPWSMSPYIDKPIEHLTQEDVLPGSDVDEEEDDEEDGADDCSHGSDDSSDEGDFDTSIALYNPSTKCCTYTTGKEDLHNGVMKLVLERAFKHCKPVISVDGAFLTGKYRGVLLIAAGMDGRVCIISDCHQGILNAVEDHMEGYQPIVSRWCMRHFAANIWHRHKNKKVIKQLKLVCAAKAERTFDIRLWKLKGMMNEEATKWLEEKMENKHKWANAFDNGARYGVQNTNISEMLNKVLKGIHAMPISAIVEFTFYKVNSYFVHRWAKARAQIDRRPNQILWGKGAMKHLATEGKKAASMSVELFDPTLYVYSMTGGRIYKVDLSSVTCTCCVPQLLHVPCSHMITAYRVRGVSHLSPAYMTQLCSKNTVLKIWESCFEPILDETHRPEHNGHDYIPDNDKDKIKVGRRKKKLLCNEMD